MQSRYAPGVAYTYSQAPSLMGFQSNDQLGDSRIPSLSICRFLSKKSNVDDVLDVETNAVKVYEGGKSYYREEDETVPVNMYGKSKLAAEQFVSSNWKNYAILRSSIIYGPQTISPVSKSLPIQWIDNVLSQHDKTDFFHDEFRCPVYVKDVVDAILALTKMWISDSSDVCKTLNGYRQSNARSTIVQLLNVKKGGQRKGMAQALSKMMDKAKIWRRIERDVKRWEREIAGRWLMEKDQLQLLLNVGGPDRLSRVQMAEAVAEFRGYNTSLIRPVPASSVCPLSAQLVVASMLGMVEAWMISNHPFICFGPLVKASYMPDGAVGGPWASSPRPSM
ncbi:hypothetical protein ACLOJK_036266 [Asimina triloba]